MASPELSGSSSDQPAGQWFEKSSSNWTSADREQARRYLDEHWADICADLPDAVATRPEVDDARKHVVSRWLYKGNSPEKFLEHCTRHLRTLMFVLLRDRDGVEVACRRLASWLFDDPVPRGRLVIIAASKDREAGPSGGPSYVWMFCEQSLQDVVTGYKPGEGSAWNYLKEAFAKYVTRNRVPEPAKKKEEEKKQEETTRPEETLWPVLDSEEDRADRQAGEMRRVLRDLKSEEKRRRNHAGHLSQTCGGCLQLRAWTLYRRELRRRAHHALDAALCVSVAERMMIKHGYVRVLICHMRHRLRAQLQRYPQRLTSDSAGTRWRVQLNRFAMWDTRVRLSCLPIDLARLPAATVIVPQGEEWSEPFELMLDNLPVSRLTGFTYGGQSDSGTVAIGSLRFNQVRLRAAANGQHSDRWIALTPAKSVDLDVKLSGAPVATLVEKGQFLPVTLRIPRGTTDMPIRIGLSAVAPGLAGVELEPSSVVGGDPVSATITVGARLVAESGDHRVEAALPMVSPAAILGELLTHTPALMVQRWRGTGPVIKVIAQTTPVPGESKVTLTATSGETTCSETLTLLPPEIESLKFSDGNRHLVDTVRAGAAIDCEIELSHVVVRDTEVALSINHSAASIKSAIVRAPGSRTKVRIEVADDAREMWARIEASANGTTKSARVLVKPKALRLSFQPSTIGTGSTSTGTLSCKPPVLVDTPFNLRIEGEEAGGQVRSSSDAGTNPLVQFDRTIVMRAGTTEACFTVTAGVAARTNVTIIAAGLGSETERVLHLASPTREREGAGDVG